MAEYYRVSGNDRQREVKTGNVFYGDLLLCLPHCCCYSMSDMCIFKN